MSECFVVSWPLKKEEFITKVSLWPSKNKITTSQPHPLWFLWGSLKNYPADLGKSLVAILGTAAAILGVGMGIRFLIDQEMSLAPENYSLMPGLGILFCLAFFLAVMAYLRTSTTAWLAEKITTNLREKLFTHMVHLKFEALEQEKLGDLLTRLTSDCDQIRVFLSGSAAVGLRTLLQLLGGGTFLVVSSPTLSLTVALLIAVVLVPLVIFGKKIKGLTYQVQTLEGDALSFAEERLNALSTLKSFTIESSILTKFSTLMATKLSQVKIRTHYRSLFIALIIFLGLSAVLVLVGLGFHEVRTGSLSPGNLSAFIFYAVLVAGSLNNLADVLGDFNNLLGATTRLMEILEKPVEFIKSQENKLPSISFQDLQFEAVSFSYPARPEAPVLQDLSFSITAGQKIALVGRSGVGKSTLFKLLLRFYDPQRGGILLNGRSLEDYPLTHLRSFFAVVPQDPVIFNASLWDNVTLGVADISSEEVLKVLKATHIEGFAKTWSEGYQTIVGEKGVRLSGGQKQRLALARALLKKAPFFLLDEATNALDSESEERLHATLQESLQGKTALIIAHRLSTIKEADKIIVLSEGGIEAQGTHDWLLSHSPLYQTLARQQFLRPGDQND